MTAARRACGVAALVWVGVGGLLAFRGARMLLVESSASDVARVIAAAIGLWVGYLKGNYVLVRTARRNRARIEALPAPHLFAAFTLRFLVLVGLMIALGAGLKELAFHGYIGWVTVGALYVGIGAALAASAPAYLRAAPAPLHTDPGPASDAHASARPGVLLVNLGTPDAPTPAAVTRYLREFLSDPKVVDVPRWLWAFVLNVIVIPRRRRRVAEAYGLIWGRDGSPLLTHTRAMAEGLAARLGVVPVEVGMRYGNPSLTTAIDSLRARGVEEVVCVPLFPQASDTTTGKTKREITGDATRGRAAR